MMVVLPTVGANIPFCVEAIVSGNETPDKMEKTGWTLVKSETVDAPVIDELPITLECRLEEMNQYDQTYRVVAEIVTIQAMWQLRIEILCKY
jgi:flavin reductase (DIM6/NTAB) family NADH-FMN oxidoreductase RutF